LRLLSICLKQHEVLKRRRLSRTPTFASLDNVVTLWVTRSEMGQGVRTNLPAALAEELEVDLDKIRLEQAMPGARFKGIRLRTSGSGSSSGTFTELRKAGAAAREMLIAAALERWVREPSTEKWVHDRSTCRANMEP
jgi:CO/xanthine dehydrogenase Mo-binding subunit